jgi:hypothetical protein
MSNFVSNSNRDFNFFCLHVVHFINLFPFEVMVYILVKYNTFILLYTFFHIKVDIHSVNYMLCTNNRTTLFVNKMGWFL